MLRYKFIKNLLGGHVNHFPIIKQVMHNDYKSSFQESKIFKFIKEMCKKTRLFNFSIILFIISETPCVFFRPSRRIAELQALPKYYLKMCTSSEVIP